MSSQESFASPTYYPSSPVGNGHLFPIYHPSSPPGHCAWGSERFPDSFHLECPHPNCPGVLAPGHSVEETFAPICPGVQPLATFHYKGYHTKGNPFNFISYPISCDLNKGCLPEVPYHVDTSSILEAQAQVIQYEVYHGGLVDLYQERQIQSLRKEVKELKKAHQELAQVGIKTWVSNGIVCWDLEHFIRAHYFSLLQSLGESLLRACPSSDIGLRGSPAPSKSSLPPFEDAFPPTFFRSGFVSRGPSPNWVDEFLTRTVNFSCPEIMTLQSLCGPLFRPAEVVKEEDGSESRHL